MPWPFAQNTNRYALVGHRSRAFLALKSQSPTGASAATPLGWSDLSLSEAKSIHQVMANVSHPGGHVFISLPLDHFEILSLSINKVPREVVGKILPYHIAKVLDEPLSEFIYDWQVVKELKDSLQLNVFLFPAKMYNDLRNTLGHYKLEPTSLEPDVFSACAFLESSNQLQPDEATMVALLWPKSISIAIYDKESLVLTRNVQLKKPDLDLPIEQEAPVEEESAAPQDIAPEHIEEPPKQDSLFANNQDDLLADFLIETKGDEAQHPTQDEQSPLSGGSEVFHTELEGMPSTQSSLSLPGYINQISLELMRTRDYFNSVVKGNQVKTVFIGGGDDAWQPLSSELQSSLDLNVERLIDPEHVSFGDSLFEAVSLGVLS